MRLFLFFLLTAAGSLPATTLRITTACAFEEMTTTSNQVSQTEITFRYGDLAIRMPKAAGWVDNPMLLRPQLLLWRHPPLVAPSTIHIELVGVTMRANAQEHIVAASMPSGGGGRYVAPDWRPATLSAGKPSEEGRPGFARTRAHADGYREEIHFAPGPEGTEVKIRLLLSPDLEPQDERAIREALAEMKVFSGRQK